MVPLVYADDFLIRQRGRSSCALVQGRIGLERLRGGTKESDAAPVRPARRRSQQRARAMPALSTDVVNGHPYNDRQDTDRESGIVKSARGERFAPPNLEHEMA